MNDAGDEEGVISGGFDDGDGIRDGIDDGNPAGDGADDSTYDASRAMVGPGDRRTGRAGRYHASGGGAGGGAAGDGAPGGGSRPVRDPLRTTIRGAGQLLITLGVIVLLFVVYEVWVTNIFGAQKQAAATEALDKQWAQDIVVDPGEVVTEPGGVVVSTAPGPTADPGQRGLGYETAEGVGFAKIYIPSFGADFVFTIVEGINQVDLYNGPGHYPRSQYPGQQGNFAVAGHRVNKGAPFDDLHLLRSCDALVIETRDDWYVYRVLPMADEVADWDPAGRAHCDGVEAPTGQYAGVYGQEITTPTDIAQVYAVPHRGGYTVPADAEALITLTTCHPKFSDAQRMIIHGVLVASYPKADGFQPAELQETD